MTTQHHHNNSFGCACTEAKPKLDNLVAKIGGQRSTLWRAQSAEHQAIVVVPAYCLEKEELERALGVDYYEERAIWTTCKRNDGVKIIFVTSGEVVQSTRTHLLNRLPPPDISPGQVSFVSVNDRTPGLCLAERLALHPDVLEEIRAEIGDRSAWLMPYLARQQDFAIADLLDIPVEGTLPELSYWGTKSGSRKLFAEAGVAHPEGFIDLSSEDEVVDALCSLWESESHPRAALVKINAGISGFGILIVKLPEQAPRFGRKEFLKKQLISAAGGEAEWAKFLKRFAKHEGVVEAFVSGNIESSPSGQGYITPTNKVSVIATHEQILGGGQIYLGASFPANEKYRQLIHAATQKVGEVLAGTGAVGYYCVDFVVADGVPFAVEINLRQTGTLHYLHTAKYLRGATFDSARGVLSGADGREVCYVGTDNLKFEQIKGTPSSVLVDYLETKGLLFDPKSGEGAVLHLLGLVEPHGKVGCTVIADSEKQAAKLFSDLQTALADFKSGAVPGDGGRHGPAATPEVVEPKGSHSTPGVVGPKGSDSLPGVVEPKAPASAPGVAEPKGSHSTPGVVEPKGSHSTPGVVGPNTSTSPPSAAEPKASRPRFVRPMG